MGLQGARGSGGGDRLETMKMKGVWRIDMYVNYLRQ